ncbi:MAG: nucleotide exchange factor GrpE [Parcubacteria group bacterium]
MTKKKECKKCEEYLNGWKRAQADFVNYKKDESHRIEDFAKFANENLLLEIIDVIDNIDRVLNEAPESIRGVDWFEGLESTRRQFDDFLKKHSIERITVGSEFDPMLHEAVLGDADGDAIEEVRAGYTLNNKVIRPSRVIIKNNNKN